MTYGTLLVGLGDIGMGYDFGPEAGRVLSHAKAFGTHPRFRLVAGVDPDSGRRELFTKSYGRPAFETVEAAAGQAAELVVVATPTALHADAVRRLLRRRPKAVLCEKPLSYDPLEARAMVEACSDAGAALYVNYVRRSDPGALEIRRRLVAGEISGPVKAVVWYSKGFLHNASHFFNLLEGWLGPARGGRVFDRGPSSPGPDGDPDVLVRFERGSAVFVAALGSARSFHAVELQAGNGRLRYDDGGARIEWFPAGGAPGEIIASGMDRYQWNVATQLASALDGNPAEICTGAEALGTLSRMKEIVDQT